MRASRVTKGDLESSKTMLAKGPHALHEYVADAMEAVIGRELPQMEVRYSNLSITADVAVIGDVSTKSELPTIYNVTKRNLAKLAPNKRMEKKNILKNASGVFKPGTITLLLGQPGSGKSSLMRVLDGQFPYSKNVTLEGDILYNGREQKDFAKQLPQFAASVTQDDKHFPSLTVRGTLEFAHEFCGGGFSKHNEELLSNGTPEDNMAALEVAKAYFKHYPDLIIDQLGLQNCQNTIIGNAMRRGVSGGERKRVTTGEMEFGMKYMTLMDEISTAAILGVLYNSIYLLFSGFNPPAASIPSGYHWLYLITTQKYSMGLLNSLVFTDCPDLPTWNETVGEYEGGSDLLACYGLTNAPSSLGHTTVKKYVESNFEYKHSEIWNNFGYVFVFIAVFRVLALLSLRFINHQKR